MTEVEVLCVCTRASQVPSLSVGKFSELGWPVMSQTTKSTLGIPIEIYSPLLVLRMADGLTPDRRQEVKVKRVHKDAIKVCCSFSVNPSGWLQWGTVGTLAAQGLPAKKPKTPKPRRWSWDVSQPCNDSFSGRL